MSRPTATAPRRLLPLLALETAGNREIYFGARQFARNHAGLIVYPPLRPGATFAEIRRLRPDGILGALWNTSMSRAIRAAGIPAVNTSNRRIQAGSVNVLADDAAIGRLGADHLRQRGFRQLAFCGIEGHPYSAERQAGFVAAARAAGLPCAICPASAPAPDSSDNQWAARTLVPWVQQLPLPIAVMACNDIRAGHVLTACQLVGRRVPEQVAILGVDNDDLICQLTDVPLSSVAPAWDRIGYEAVALLVRLLRGGAPPRTPVRIPPRTVVTRQSTDVLAVADPKVLQALRQIQAAAGKPLYVEDVARQVGMSRRALERRFRQVLNRSPNEEILQAHLERACHLLAETDLTINEVAAACGFSEPRELTVTCRKRLRLTPTAYRHQFRLR